MENNIIAYHHEYRENLKAERRARAVAILKDRYSTEPPMSYAKLAKKYNISRQRAHQICNDIPEPGPKPDWY